MVHTLAIETERFQILSSVEVPLTVDATDWRAALCMGMQLLEREQIVARLELRHAHGVVVALDPHTGEEFEVHSLRRARLPISRAA